MSAQGQLMPGSANPHGTSRAPVRSVDSCEHRLPRDGRRPRNEETLPVAHTRCPVEAALAVLDDRWKTLIVWRLFWGARRFCELMRATPGLSRKTLRRQLADLERHGLVRRRLPTGDRRGAEYVLTLRGETLKPLVSELYVWGLALLDEDRGGPASIRLDAAQYGAGTS